MDLEILKMSKRGMDENDEGNDSDNNRESKKQTQGTRVIIKQIKKPDLGLDLTDKFFVEIRLFNF